MYMKSNLNLEVSNIRDVIGRKLLRLSVGIDVKW